RILGIAPLVLVDAERMEERDEQLVVGRTGRQVEPAAGAEGRLVPRQDQERHVLLIVIDRDLAAAKDHGLVEEGYAAGAGGSFEPIDEITHLRRDPLVNLHEVRGARTERGLPGYLVGQLVDVGRYADPRELGAAAAGASVGETGDPCQIARQRENEHVE